MPVPMRNPSAGREVFSGGPRVSAWSAACTKECGMLPHWRNPGKPCFRDKGKTCINTERVNTGETGKSAKLPKTGKSYFRPRPKAGGGWSYGKMEKDHTAAWTLAR